ncbi:MAG: DoxX family protein [Planctomycetes bacterium]|nr:DoxX family protein [Planctomycetota bacterium]
MMRRFLLPDPPSDRASLGLLAARLVAGIGLAMHGWGKIQNPFGWMGEKAATPGVLQALAALSEFGGGLALVVGLLVPLASLGIVCTMSVAAWTHISRGDPFLSRRDGGAYELAALYLVISLLLLAAGPGRFSLDALIGRQTAHGSEQRK